MSCISVFTTNVGLKLSPKRYPLNLNILEDKNTFNGGQAGVHGDEQVEGLGLANLANQEAVRPHAQRLLDQAAQADLPECDVV